MHEIAQQLNTHLSGTVVPRLFSQVGKNLYFPKGIVAQAAEASTYATHFNATVGMAYQGNEPMMLPLFKELMKPLTPHETVAYAPTAGVAELRTLWKQSILTKNPSIQNCTITLPAVVPGITAGICIAADLFAEAGDTIIIPDLFWGNYRLIFCERHKCQIHEFPFFHRNTRFHKEALQAAIRDSAKTGKVILLLNFPNNPAGFTPSKKEVEAIKHICIEAADTTPLLVISDDAYFGLFYTQDTHKESIFAQFANAHPNILAVKADGVTKEDFAWGLRIGFLTMAFQGMTQQHASALEEKLKGAIRSAVSNSPRISQSLVIRALKHHEYDKQKKQTAQILLERFHIMQDILTQKEKQKRAPALIPMPCNSGYFMSFQCNDINAETLRLHLLYKKHVGVISVKNTYIRVAFAGVEGEHLHELYETIFTAAEELANT